MRNFYKTSLALITGAALLLAPYACFISHSLAHYLEIGHSAHPHHERSADGHESHPAVELNDLNSAVLLKAFRACLNQTAMLMETLLTIALPANSGTEASLTQEDPPGILFSAGSFDLHPIKAPPEAASGLLF
jgi:hypothetical protein